MSRPKGSKNKKTVKKAVVLNKDNILPVLNQMQEHEGLPKTVLHPYITTLIVMGKKYTAKGASVIESLAALEGMGNVRGKIILTVEHDGVKRERVIMPNNASRLFSASKMQREIALKQTSQLFF